MATRSYCVIVAKTREGVEGLAKREGWTILNPFRDFSEMESLDDGSLGNDIGRLFTQKAGIMALAYRED